MDSMERYNAISGRSVWQRMRWSPPPSPITSTTTSAFHYTLLVEKNETNNRQLRSIKRLLFSLVVLVILLVVSIRTRARSDDWARIHTATLTTSTSGSDDFGEEQFWMQLLQQQSTGPPKILTPPDIDDDQFWAQFRIPLPEPQKGNSITCLNLFPTCKNSILQRNSTTQREQTYRPEDYQQIPSEIGLLTHLTSLGAGDIEAFTHRCSPCFAQPSSTSNPLPAPSDSQGHRWSVEPAPSSTLPSEIGLLTLLQDLWLDDISGTLPTQLGQLLSLSLLDVSYNNLYASLPTEVGLLTQLTELRGTYTGHLQHWFFITELGKLTKLRVLVLGDSEQTRDYAPSQTLPTQLGLLTELTYFEAPNTGLKGTIPSQLGQLTLLTSLNLGYNYLTGSLPTEAGLLTQLTFLDLVCLESEGSASLPSELGLLTKLKTKDIQFNDVDPLAKGC